MDQVFKRLNIEWGPKVGASLDKVLQFITKPTPESAAKAEDSISSLFKETFTAENIAALIGKSINLANIPGLIIGALIDKPIQEFLTNLSAELFTIPPKITKLFTDFGQNIWNNLIAIPPFLLSLFTDLGSNIWNGLMSVPNLLYDVFTGLANDIGSRLSGIPQAIWNAIMSVVNSIKSSLGFGGNSLIIGSTIQNGETPTATRTASIAETLP